MSDNQTQETNNEWLPEDLKADPKLSSYKSPAELAKAYKALESKLGGSVSIPTESDPEGWQKLYDRLGRPKDPNEYEVGDPSDPVSERFKNVFHAAGLSKNQAKQIGEAWKASVSEANANQKKTVERFEAELLSDWGERYAANQEIVERGLVAVKGTAVETAYNNLLAVNPKLAKSMMLEIGSKAQGGSTAKTPPAPVQTKQTLREELNKHMMAAAELGAKSPLLLGRGRPETASWFAKFDQINTAIAEGS